MKYINHNSSNVVTKATTDIRADRLQELQARLVAARELVKSDVGPTAPDGGSVTAEEVFKHLVAVCKHNQIDLLDIAEMLMAVDTVSEAEETKVAAQAVTTNLKGYCYEILYY